MVITQPRTQPYHWWGLPWTPPNPHTMTELVELGMIGADAARLLVEHVQSGGSITVAAGPSGAGKSTLAHALSAEIPTHRSLAYIRGGYEQFAWLADTSPSSTTILVNEISPHLPTYCWGEQARTVLQLAANGYQLVATLHADSTDELVALLQAPPINATMEQVVALNVVVFLDIVTGQVGVQRHIASVVQLELERESARIKWQNLPV